MKDPYLVDGHKFDLRCYVLVSSYTPLQALFFGEGMVRFAATPYSGDLKYVAILPICMRVRAQKYTCTRTHAHANAHIRTEMRTRTHTQCTRVLCCVNI